MANRGHDKMTQRGWEKINWAWAAMPVLSKLVSQYEPSQPLKGCRLSACLHLEAKTACLLIGLTKLGAQVHAAGSNPLSTQDDVCCALDQAGVAVHSHHGMTGEEYTQYLKETLVNAPHVIVDDGADLVVTLLEHMPSCGRDLRGASEETTSGVKRLKALQKEGKLTFPVISVNDAQSKYLFDNRYGTGQSVMDGLIRSTNMLVAGKKVVIAGYGWCGRGAALRAAALGAQVLVTEVDPHKAFEALMDGHQVMTMEQAATLGDIFLTFTGNTRVIRREHFALMKDNVVLGNAGHFDMEIDKNDLLELCGKPTRSREGIDTYRTSDGRRLNLLGEGRLVNLACADGHPIEIMDLSFALQLEAALRAYTAPDSDRPGLIPVPQEIDRRVIQTKLDSLGISIDHLTEEQEAYMADWRED